MTMMFRASLLLFVVPYYCSCIVPHVGVTCCAAFISFGRRRSHYVDSTRFADAPASATDQSQGASTAPPSFVACYNIAGFDPDRPSKVNQDAWFHIEFLDHVCVGVMDGHGLKGHELTSYLRDQLPMRIQQLYLGDKISEQSLEALETFEQQLHDYGNAKKPISENWRLEEQPPSATPISSSDYIPMLLTKAFHLAHVDAMQDKTTPAGRTAGTTCIVALFDKKTGELWIGHVGDSRALLVSGASNEGSSWSASKSRFVVKTSTTETTIRIPEELERIESGDGRHNANGNVFYGPVGIAMTRALGDCVMLRAGILPTPVIVKQQLIPSLTSSNIVVLATDGVWDVLSNQQVADILGDCHRDGSASSLNEAAKVIAETARQQWKGNLPLDDAKVDDITCLLLSV